MLDYISNILIQSNFKSLVLNNMHSRSILLIVHIKIPNEASCSNYETTYSCVVHLVCHHLELNLKYGFECDFKSMVNYLKL